MKHFCIATLAGAVAFFLLGGVLYGLLLADFYASNLGSATGVLRELPVFWALAVSQMGYSALVTYLFQHAGVNSMVGGLKTGAIFGLMLGIAIAFDLHAVTNWSNQTVAFVEPFVTAVRMALAGAVIGWVLGKLGGAGHSG